MAAEEADVLASLVFDELRRGTDTGEGRSREQLREACGVGAGDLDRILTRLRESGAVSEQAPDEFVLTSGPDEPAVPEVEVEAEEDERDDAPLAAALPGRPRQRPQRVEASPAHVSMPRGVAGVLDEAALGSLVKAGIENAGEGESFVFEVTP